jgi:hypothetical protein
LWKDNLAARKSWKQKLAGRQSQYQQMRPMRYSANALYLFFGGKVMLEESELHQLCQKFNLSKQAQQVVDEIRSSPPTRRVRSAAGNVSVRYPSRKMGVIIQAESHRNELAGIYEKEYDPVTLEYYDQPPQIKLIYEAKNGRKIGIWHIPDYFVFRKDGIGWEEWKTEAELPVLATQMPHRYVQEGNIWRCPPGEEYAMQFGFFYRVRSSAEIDWILQRNLLFLEDYLRADQQDLDGKVIRPVMSLVAEHPSITLQELLEAEMAPGDIIFTLIARGELYVDLHAAPLAEPQRVQIFRDQETAKGCALIASSSKRDNSFVAATLGASMIWDDRSWTIVNLGATQVTLLAMDGSLIDLPQTAFENLIKTGRLFNFKESISTEMHPDLRDLLAKASPSDFQEANRRYTIIAPRLTGCSPDRENVPARTIRRWMRNWKKAEVRYGCGYVGLLPQRQDRGNRHSKMPNSVLDMMNEFIANDYETLKQKTKAAVYGTLVRKCDELGILPTR